MRFREVIVVDRAKYVSIRSIGRHHSGVNGVNMSKR
jgi:hypothetical protein